jgi:hypothetical protein
MRMFNIHKDDLIFEQWRWNHHHTSDLYCKVTIPAIAVVAAASLVSFLILAHFLSLTPSQ